MKKPTTTPREDLLRNLKALMDEIGDNTVTLAAKSGVPQRTIYNILYSDQKVSVDQAEALVAAYGAHGWELVMHDVPPDPATLRRVDQLVRGYLEADAETQAVIDLLFSKALANR